MAERRTSAATLQAAAVGDEELQEKSMLRGTIDFDPWRHGSLVTEVSGVISLSNISLFSPERIIPQRSTGGKATI